MKKIISYILIIGMVLCSGFIPVYAEEEVKVENIEEITASGLKIGDKFKINNGNKEYTVVEEDTDKIYLDFINDKKQLKINHFEVTTEVGGKQTWRKYVNLSELCNQTDICELNKSDGDKGKYDAEISIARKYNMPLNDTIVERDENNNVTNIEKLKRDVYYTTYHKIGTNRFQSNIFISDYNDINPIEEYNPSKVGKFYNFGDNVSDKFDESGEATLVDVESFIDSTNQVYISLRFLSEALGCRVDWLSKKVNDTTDAVLIRFYDSDSYCKKLEVTYPNPDQKEFPGTNTISSKEMYDYVLEIANKGTEKSMNVDINYSYWNDNSENVQQGTTKWLSLYLSGDALNYTENDFDNNQINAPLVQWNNDSDALLHFFSEINDKNNSNTAFSKACKSNSDNNGKLISLEGCVDISGIFMYYGVPIPIKLLSAEADEIYNNCDIDPNTYEKINK